jgi:cytochrome c peroxidase
MIIVFSGRTRAVFLRKPAAAAIAFLAAGFLQNLLPLRAQAFAGTPSGPSAAVIAALGKKIFFDPTLSASGRMSCATCHDPEYAYGPPNGLAVQLGGPRLDRQGVRAVPSLRYGLNRTPVWHKPFVKSLAQRILEGEEPARGGFAWDGRFNSLHEQAAAPFLDPNEMANASVEEVVGKLRRAPYAAAFRETFGGHIFDDPAQAFAQASLAIERFELDDPSFHPYSSKFDDYLDGKTQLTEQELRGLKLFDDPRQGNSHPVIRIARASTDHIPCLQTMNSRRSAFPATWKFASMPGPNTTTWDSVGLCARIKAGRTDFAASLRRQRFATAPPKLSTSTTAASIP